MRRLALILLLVPFLGVPLAKPPGTSPPPSPPPAFTEFDDTPIETPGPSVLLFPLDPAAEAFRLTAPADGVPFDLDGDGTRETVAWSEPAARVALLARDINGDGAITSGRELIGSATDDDVRYGWRALLAMFRRSGAQPAGSIRAGHELYDQLLLWVDANHNGRSDRGELTPVREQFTAIGMGFQGVHWADPHGNVIRFEGWMQARTAGPEQDEATDRLDEQQRRRRYFEVALRTAR